MTATLTRPSVNTYNGWANYETWNVVLWMQNDEGLYSLIEENDVCCYEEFLELMDEIGCTQTPDGVKWNDPKINRPEINGDCFDF